LDRTSAAPRQVDCTPLPESKGRHALQSRTLVPRTPDQRLIPAFLTCRVAYLFEQLGVRRGKCFQTSDRVCIWWPRGFSRSGKTTAWSILTPHEPIRGRSDRSLYAPQRPTIPIARLQCPGEGDRLIPGPPRFEPSTRGSFRKRFLEPRSPSERASLWISAR